MTELPNPLVPAEIDVRDLPGFMLNTERLMASELVAVCSREAIGAALLLWCRAWKQVPAASLPDDERVLAAYSGLGVPRFRKLRQEVLHGFVKCNDGRLYHKTLSEEAVVAFKKKQQFRNKRETDAERLRNWRAQRIKNNGETTIDTHSDTICETHDETLCETHDETRFVQEGQGQGQGQGLTTTTTTTAVGVDVTVDGRDTSATRLGELCKRLRCYGIDAPPHLDAWAQILPFYRDDEIVAVAQSAREKKPGERLHLNYLVPMLRDRKPRSATATPNLTKSRAVAADTRLSAFTDTTGWKHGERSTAIEG
ncbi:MAG: DUF1376 domain-containing protein [Rhodocyclaceae bacterium]|nr:DUF1376 domain-containing protein [Rhodocyclaceae bacterium]